MTKELPSPELLRKLLRYEPDTGKLFWRERTPDMFANKNASAVWNGRHAGQEALSTLHNFGYMCGDVCGRKCLAHRVVWAIVYGQWPQKQIDHINGDKADNRVENLREVTHQVNARNANMRVTNTSGYNGVCWQKNNKKWVAYIKIDGRRKHLGHFDDIRAAAAARKAAEIGYGFTERHGK